MFHFAFHGDVKCNHTTRGEVLEMNFECVIAYSLRTAGLKNNINGVHINFQNPSKCNKVDCEPALLGGWRRAPSNPLPPSFSL